MNGKLIVLFKGVIGDKGIIIKTASIIPTSPHQNCLTYKIEFDLPQNFDQNEIVSFVSFMADDEKMYRFAESPKIIGGHFSGIGLH